MLLPAAPAGGPANNANIVATLILCSSATTRRCEPFGTQARPAGAKPDVLHENLSPGMVLAADCALP